MHKCKKPLTHHYRILSVLFLFLLTSCQVQVGNITFGGHDLHAPDPTVEISTVVLCNGLNETNQPIKMTSTVLSENVENVYVCVYQQKGGAGLLTIRWFQTEGGYLKGNTYVEADDGWFSAKLETSTGTFPVGMYEVRVQAGRAIQATTEFQVISK